ncbi:MAG: hypothetical protein HOC74_33650 [Gemmatimonadetes bacterium]|jgi:hypothetical protein|nr:hypothetical protein [Gemmatimonadota bacterium]
MNTFFRFALVLVVCCSGAGVSHAHHGGAMAFAIPLTGIQIDGKLGDWPEEMVEYPILNHQQAYGPTDIDAEDLTASADLSPSFMVGFDARESLLYLAVRVRDDALFVSSANQWSTDACEVFVNGRHDDGVAMQYVMCPPGGSYGDVIRSAAPGANPNLRDGDITTTRTRGMVGREGDVTVYEWGIELFDQYPDSPTALAVGTTVGFDVVAVDKDGERENSAWVCWAPFGVRKDRNGGLLGDLVLIESAAVLGTIAGQVTRPNDGSPWSGIEVYMRDRKGKMWGRVATGEDGGYRIKLPAGTYYLSVAQAEGREPIAVDLQAGEEIEGVDFAPSLISITGRVTFPNGSPRARVDILVEAEEGGTRKRVTTDIDGRYLTWVEPGSYRVLVVDATGGDTLTVGGLQAGEQVDGIDFAPKKIGSTLPTWPFTTGLALFGAVILACLVPLVRRRELLGGILLSPGLTLQEVAEKPDWVGPFCLVMVSSLLAAVIMLGKMLTGLGGFPGGGLPIGAQIATMIVMPMFTTLAVLIAAYLSWLIRGGTIWGLGRISGDRVPFYPLISVVGYAFLPEMLLTGIAMAIGTGFGGVQASSPWDGMVTSLAGLLPGLGAGNAPLRALLGEIELFSFWSLGLTIVGVQRVYGFSMRKAGCIGVLYWLLAVGAIVGFAFLADLFRQMMAGM